MITIYITPELIEAALVTGTMSRPFRILEGLPKGAKLLSANWSMILNKIELCFTDPERGPDRIIDLKLEAFQPVEQKQEQSRVEVPRAVSFFKKLRFH